MTATTAHPHTPATGIRIEFDATQGANPDAAYQAAMAWFSGLDLAQHVRTARSNGAVQLWLDEATAQQWAPAHDTLQLQRSLAPSASDTAHALTREIAVALLLAPRAMMFPSAEELFCAVRIRQHIVNAAAKTALAFHTEAAERPAHYWHYDEEHGFLLQPGQCLIAALIAATQPDATGRLYDFSCYRATEYVILLGLAQELQTCNPDLFEQLQNHCRAHAIRSGAFHEVFLVEYGSMDQPLPPLYYVPGDRLWFRNPDEASSDATGYEGSWVMYLGGGLFTNFWKQGQPYTLADKCLEIYHWRHATYTDEQGQLQIDETVVEARVAATRQDPAMVAQIMEKMQKLRDPKGVYAEGGCMDTSREFPRWVRPGTSDLVLPALAPD